MISQILLGLALAASLGGVGFAKCEPTTSQASAKKPWKDGGTYSTPEAASARQADLMNQGYEARVVQNVFNGLWYVIYR